MDYVGNVIRPPSEADSIILQVTVGCSHNKCSFCGSYRDQVFQLKPADKVAADLDFAARYCRRQKKIFLADGDVLSLPQNTLVRLFVNIREKLPFIRRISLYGNARGILRKSRDELRALKELGLARVYMGLESGQDEILKRINKGVNSAQQIAAGQLIRESGLFLSVTILLGIAGREDSADHAVKTGEVISAIGPNQVGALTLMLLPGTRLERQHREGRFRLPNRHELLKELALIIQNINLPRTQFQANHASNYLPINCRLPRDRELVLEHIHQALRGEIPLKPEQLRAL